MKKVLIFLFVTLINGACFLAGPDFATDEQKQQAMKAATFDKKVIENIERYIDFKNFLEKNIDSLIDFRFSKNTVMLVGSGGTADSTYLADDACYNFFEGNARYDISNVPDFLRKQMDSFFHSFANMEIKSFEICKNKRIKIETRVDDMGNGLFIFHTLKWNSKIETDPGFRNQKDTIINKDCIYTVGLSESHGW